MDLDLRLPPGPWDNEDDDDTFDKIDWSNPKSIFDSFALPKPTSFPTADEVRKEARECSQKILGDWKLLNGIIERQEAVIQKRWSKKTKERRKKILLSAYPNMPLTHRPDFEAFTKGEHGTPTRFREAYMWPCINQEDLLKPRLLLLFLNARGRNPPSAFSRADFDATHFGHVTGSLRAPYLGGYTMMFTGRNTPGTYGELISWDDNKNAAFWLTSQRGMHPGHGLQILEIQQRIYSFLVECCASILHDIPRESLADREMPIQHEPPAVPSNETGIITLASVAAEAPYRLPASLDFNRLQAIVAAKRSAAECHIWALREDPGYFADAVLDQKDHRQELLPDTHGRPHPVLRPLSEGILWNRVIGNVISNSYLAFVLWDTLHQQIVGLQSAKEKYSRKILPEHDLPPDFLKAFLKFRYNLQRFSKAPIGLLKLDVPGSPPLRPFFVRQPQAPDTTIISAMTKPDLPKDKSRERLLWIFSTLWDEKRLELTGLHPLMDEIERLSENDPKAKELISSNIASTISDISVMSECLHQIELYQPWAATFTDETVSRIEELEKEYTVTTTGWAEFNKKFEGSSLAKLGTPTDGRFFYPVDRRRTRETTEAMRRAEEQLDAFWRAADSFTFSDGGRPQNPALRHLLSSKCVLQRTPEWVETVKAAKAATPVAQDENLEGIYKPFSQLYFGSEQQPEREDIQPTSSIKTKTRGVARPPDASEIIEREQPFTPAASADSHDVQPTFLVDKRAMKVFAMLFHTPLSRSSMPGEVSWTDFLHALVSTGFKPEKLYGSVWQFTPANLDVERSIQFHEPHPSGKIPFCTARRHGRRLFRVYGWHGAMFRLREE
ncbi:MAG: hypothetical protein M1813_005880 [Trichoglossum hirsutum]|nr:MAG: hypothetical protein M1813_005880 [Trichoglossum hirsutum]